MNHTQERPITDNWTIATARADESAGHSAKDVNQKLAEIAVDDLAPELVPYLAAAAAELDQITALTASSLGGEGPVALLRKIAKAAISQPDARGLHTHRLGEQLQRLCTPLT